MIFILSITLLLLFSLLLWVRAVIVLSRPRLETRSRRWLMLRFDAPGGVWQTADLPPEAFDCGFSDTSDIDLRFFIPSPRSAGRAGSAVLRFEPEGSRLKVTSGLKVLINGVEKRDGTLSPGEALRLAGLKISYLGERCEKEQRELPRSAAEYPKTLLLPLLFSLLVPAALMWLPHRGTEPEIRPLPESAAAGRRQPEADTASRLRPPSELTLIAPGEMLPETAVDVLFIHAHPDDESIDFGSLLAHCEAAGLKTAVVLMTDGEGGIYQEEYQGIRENLPALRIAEAREALSILGADYYIRLGLPNHPYNSRAQEIGTNEIFRSWGGEAVLRASLADIIEALWPAVVVSPDGPSAAREHFEHVATGILVAKTLEDLKARGGYSPAAHLVCVDPRQQDVYQQRIAISRRGAVSFQRQALLAHRTQADASYFAVKMIEEYRNEYYHVLYWSLDEPPTSFFLPY
jgi:LmbE family N-acetylglucosaminyl deacetylase